MTPVKLVLFCLFLFATAARAESVLSAAELSELAVQKPYWQSNSALKKSMLEEFKVTTSAIHDDNYYSMKGAGIAKVPADFAFQQAQNFERLQALKGSFESVSWDASAKTLRVKVKFLTGSKESVISLSTITQEKGGQIHFKVTEGWMTGFFGVLKFEEQAAGLTEVSLLSLSKDRIHFMPDFIVLFAVEGIMQYVAISVRSWMERDYLDANLRTLHK